MVLKSIVWSICSPTVRNEATERAVYATSESFRNIIWMHCGGVQQRTALKNTIRRYVLYSCTHDPSSYYHETTCELLNENHASARFCFHVRRHFCQFSSILALYCHGVFNDDLGRPLKRVVLETSYTLEQCISTINHPSRRESHSLHKVILNQFEDIEILRH